MVTYVFPGQGSQFVGMGADLFDKYEEYLKQADEILGYSIKELCLEDPMNNLGNTKYTQVALYVVSALTYLEKVETTSIIPDFVAGHSLGEYVALFAAGVFDFATGLKIVKKRAELMAEANGGLMAAVIGLTDDVVRKVLLDNQFSGIDIANLNSYNQIVIAGTKEDIDNAQTAFEQAGAVTYVKLKVSGAFHSRYMEIAKEEFAEYIKQFEFHEPQITVYSNVTAKPYVAGEIHRNLVEQIVSTVRWCEIITDMMCRQNNQIIQLGPGNVLTGLTRKITREIKKMGIELKPVKDEAEKRSERKLVTAEQLGSKEFRADYNLKYAYCSGGMYKGIASAQLVSKMANAGMLSFLGCGGVGVDKVEEWIQEIKAEVPDGVFFGLNVMGTAKNEEALFDLIEKYDIHCIEAAAYISITENLVKYRVRGLEKKNGSVIAKNKVMAKISRPEVAEVFMAPAPEKILNELLKKGIISEEQKEMAKQVSMADDICVEGDSGGHTDRGNLLVMLPAFQSQGNRLMEKYGYQKKIRIGAAGGVGAPGTIAAVFMMGADFVMTGSINQCTVEAGISDNVKAMLNEVNIQDTDYCVSGDMFEWGSVIQVLKKGVFFPIRANKLYDLYKKYNSLDEIDEKTKEQLVKRYFRKSFEEIWTELCAYYSKEEIAKAEANKKYRMLLTFKWYYAHTTQLALNGDSTDSVNYQVQCGSSMGAFNQYVLGTELENWKNRHVDEIAVFLLTETVKYMNLW